MQRMARIGNSRDAKRITKYHTQTTLTEWNENMTIGTFGTFEAEAKVNPYAATFVEFAKAVEKNPDIAWSVELDANRETAERVLIAEAAHSVDRTARLRTRDDSKREKVGERPKSGNPIYEGKVTLTFTLSPKHAPRKGK
jgi:hypothetical protein